MRENFAVEKDYGITDEEYEIVDEPYLGYQVHLNKLSCGWRPLFQMHKNIKIFKELEDFCLKNKMSLASIFFRSANTNLWKVKAFCSIVKKSVNCVYLICKKSNRRERGVMAYEIDFISVKESEAKQDADAILIRWKNEDSYKIAVYDGGFQAHGEKMQEHLDSYYFEAEQDKVIDAVIVSHPDQDHTSGLKVILENYTVNALYMNRPWIYAQELYDNNRVIDGRITENSLGDRLKKKYSYIADLEEIADEKGIPIYEVFEGTVIENVFTVLSPSRDFYLDLIVESDKTPLEEYSNRGVVYEFAQKVSMYIKKKLENWFNETLREEVITSVENEMSVVLFGAMEEENFLLVGDAGLRALNKANSYAIANGISLKDDITIMQIPHHGGRHNVSTSLLNEIIGEPVKEGEECGKDAFVCAADKSDHPLQMVVNAYVRRGVRVYTAKGNIIHHHKNMPERPGWTTASNMTFDPNVEEWND